MMKKNLLDRNTYSKEIELIFLSIKFSTNHEIFTSVDESPEYRCFRLCGTSPHSGQVIWYNATSPLSISLQWLHGADFRNECNVDLRLPRNSLLFLTPLCTVPSNINIKEKLLLCEKTPEEKILINSRINCFYFMIILDTFTKNYQKIENVYIFYKFENDFSINRRIMIIYRKLSSFYFILSLFAVSFLP